MKRRYCILIVFLLIVPVRSQAQEVEPDHPQSFEADLSEVAHAEGGEVQLTDEQVLDGEFGLRWDYEAGDALVLPVDNFTGMVPWGGYGNHMRPAFVFPIHLPVVTEQGHLLLEIRVGEDVIAELTIPFAFSGWQRLVQHWTWRSSLRWVDRARIDEIDNFRLRAVDTAEPMHLYIDGVNFNKRLDWRESRSPVTEIWRPLQPDFSQEVPPTADELENMDKLTQHLRSSRHGPLERTAWDRGFEGLRQALDEADFAGSGTIHLHDGIRYLSQCASTYSRAPDEESRRLAGAAFAEVNGWLQRRGMVVNGALGRRDNYVGRGYTDIVAPMAPVLAEHGQLESTRDYLRWSYRYDQIFGEEQSAQSMDYFHNNALRILKISTMFADPVERWHHLTAVRHAVQSQLVLSIRPDGSIWHHGFHYFAYGSMAMNSISNTAVMLTGFDLPLSEPALDAIKTAVMRMRWYAGGRHVLFSLCGRSPGEPGINPNTFYALARAYRPFRDGQLDAELASAYLRLVPEDAARPEFDGIEAEAAPAGFVSMPWAGLGLHRRDDWLAGVHGYSRYIRAGESYAASNRFGLYLSNGFLELHTTPRPLPGLYDSGYRHNAGWNWFALDGTTTIWSTLEHIANGNGGRSETSGETMVGGLSHDGRNGLFVLTLASKFQADLSRTEEQRASDEADPLRARKSWFFFSNRIICVGTGIGLAACDYPVRTALFQRFISEEHAEVSWDGDVIQVTETPIERDRDASQENTILEDGYGNYFLVPGEQNTFLRVGEQRSRDGNDREDVAGTFAAAWIDHGVEPEDASYFYAVIVQGDQPQAQAIRDSLVSDDVPDAIRVLVQSNDMHAVHDRVAQSVGYVIWNPDALEEPCGELVAVSRPCLVMIETQGEERILSLTDPDLRAAETDPLSLSITLRGRWQGVDLPDGVGIEVQGETSRVTVPITNAESVTLRLLPKEESSQ